MPISFTLAKEAPGEADVLGVPVFAGERSGPGAELDEEFLADRGFKGKPGETLAIPADDGTTVIAVGLGDRSKLDLEGVRRAAAALVRASWRNERVATTLLAAVPESLDRVKAAQALAEGASMAAYRFTR